MSLESPPKQNPAVPDPMIGRLTLSRYRIVKPLAHGGMGVVYLGRIEGAAGFSRPVVIKRVLPELSNDPNIGKMFVREARILSNLNHAGIVGVVDFGQEDDAYVMVLEYVHGFDTNQWLTYLKRKGRSVPMDVALQIVIRVLEALHHAHSLRRADGTPTPVVHRDISPSNILLDSEGHVRLLDFGLARIANAANEYRTQESMFKGKLGYAHPSLLLKGEPSAQTDIYSAAVVLFQLLSGTNPFRGKTPAETLNKVLRGEVPRLRDTQPDAPEELERVLTKGLSRDLNAAFSSASEMADALRALRAGGESEVDGMMSRMLAADFYGDMPEVLEVEPLGQREAAWRADVRTPLRSTRPHPPDADEPTRIRRTSSDDPTISASDITGQSSPVAAAEVPADPSTIEVKSATQSEVIIVKQGAPQWLWIVLAVGLGSAGTWAFGALRGGTPAPAPAVAPAQVPPVEVAAASAQIAPPAAASVAANTAEDSPESLLVPVKPDLGVLTRRFAPQASDAKSCFDKHPSASDTHAQLSFSVNTEGVPTTIALVPQALDGTPVGRCLLNVARAARFGKLTDPVTFRIPIR